MEAVTGIFLYYYLAVFALAVAFGFAAQKSSFCPVGGMRDLLSQNNAGRLWTYFAAIAVAILSVSVIEWLGWVELSQTRPPYRGTEFAWGRYVIGGFIFGFGMVLAAGCGMRNLVRVGQGSYKAIWLVAIMAISAYIMTRTAFYADWIMPVVAPLSANFSEAGAQDLASLVVGSTADSHGTWSLIISWLIGLTLLWFAFKNADFRRPSYILSALAIGLVIAGAYWLTSGNFAMTLQDEAMFMASPPEGLGAQSFTFAAPMGDLVYYLMSPTQLSLVTFGVLAVIGLAVGSLIGSLLTKQFSVAGFSSKRDGLISSLGAVLVGFGAVLAMGCSVGHGLSGTATLALGSFVALAAILAGSYVGLKLEPMWRGTN